MDHLELVKLLANELEPIRIHFEAAYTISKYLESLHENCQKLHSYCKDVLMNNCACSEIYHEDMMKIFKVIEEIKSFTKDYKLVDNFSSFDHVKFLVKFEDVLEPNFYKHYVIIDGPDMKVEDTFNKELKRYIDKGRILKDHPLTLKLKEELSKWRMYDISCYCALIGPSLIGKTQTAITLSHIMDVFYVNFSGFFINEKEQEVYQALKPPSILLRNTILSDVSEMSENDIKELYRRGPYYFLYHFFGKDRRCKTLGLLYTLIKWKNNQKTEFEDPEKWFNSFGEMKNVVISPLTVFEFQIKKKKENLNVKNTVMFIDECSDIDPNDHMAITVSFLRCLCQAFDIPVILSGRDPAIGGTLSQHCAPSHISSMDRRLRPWAKIVTRTPNDSEYTLKCLGCSIDIKIANANETVKLDKFIENSKVKIDQLCLALIGNNEDSPFVKTILEFLFDNLGSYLPGFVTNYISFALNELSSFSTKPFDLKILWPKIVNEASIILRSASGTMNSSNGIIATANILTRINSLKDDVNNVRDHFYLYGLKSTSIFNVYNSNSTSIKYIDRAATDDFNIDLVHFPELNEDFMLTVSCLGTLHMNVDSNGKMLGTLGHYLREYLGSNKDNIIDCTQFELLSQWSICSASHLSVSGNAKLIEVIECFLKNIQVVLSVKESGSGIDFKPVAVPAGLRNFLNQFEVPYLFPNATKYNTIVNRVSSFMTIGNTQIVTNECSVVFDVKRIGDEGFTTCHIECKLSSKSVGIPMIYKYYEKACKDSRPITILVAGSFQESLRNSEVIEKWKPISSEEKSDEEGKSARIYYIRLLDDLWTVESKRVSIYSIESDILDFSFKCTALKEFENPVGIFLVFNSNFIMRFSSNN